MDHKHILIDTADDFLKIRKELNYYKIFSKKSKKYIEIPCLDTLLVNRNLVKSNDYNPNKVAILELDLLKESILNNGFCFPIVAIFDDISNNFIIVDGFHRNLIVGENYLDLDYVPLVCLNHDINNRMTATVQFNRARGKHQVDLQAEMVKKLLESGMKIETICKKLGMTSEELMRLLQNVKVCGVLANKNYGNSWEIHTDEDNS